MAAPILSLRNAWLSLGEQPLLQDVSLAIARGERACLLGRNGAGKSTLLKAMAGLVELEQGELYIEPGLKLAYMPQETEPLSWQSVAEHVATGLPENARESEAYRVAMLLESLGLSMHVLLGELSGGELRRAELARALVGRPDVLLLDEPTNHLDLPTIEWLEGELIESAAGLVVISHDRAFLTRVARRMHWLDRGRLRTRQAGFAEFEAWAEAELATEAAERRRADKALAAETQWLHRGVTARRRRNQGRLRQLQALRRERAQRIEAPGSVRLATAAGELSGRLVIEAEGLRKSLGGRRLVDGFSTRILRRDRVGVIGANGAGKTTLLQLLTGRLAPDAGTLRLGSNLSMAWFDQRRSSLREESTLQEVLCDSGGDQVMVRGQPRHVASYLRDFLFAESQMRAPVKALSGGERNRLLLAKLLARPSNLLVLDEPTNDLDMDTLDLLQEMLADYPGTLLLVSHDRDFLDRLVTSVIVMAGEGRVTEHVGGYADHLAAAAARADRLRPPAPGAAAREPGRPPGGPRMTYRDRRELELLPAKLAALQEEIAALEHRLDDAALYARDPAGFAAAAARLTARRRELLLAEERWLDLELQREALDGEKTSR